MYSCSLTLQLNKLEVNHNLLNCIQFEPEYMYTVASNCLILFMLLITQVLKSHILAYLVCFVVFICCCCFFFYSGMMSTMEYTVFDEWFKYLMSHEKPQIDLIGE